MWDNYNYFYCECTRQVSDRSPASNETPVWCATVSYGNDSGFFIVQGVVYCAPLKST